MDRDARLRGLSSDHHHALVLARTIRKQYVASSSGYELLNHVRGEFERELAPHFEIEEEILLPALAASGQGDLAERIYREHAALREHLNSAAGGDSIRILKFAEALEAHVRFEERTLFPACEAILDGATLEAVMRRRPPPRPRKDRSKLG